MDHAHLTSLQADVARHELILRGDGNGTPGLTHRVRVLESRDEDVKTVIKEWNTMKAQLQGAKWTLVAVGIILAGLGGGLGVAILKAVSQLAAGVP